MNSPSHKSKYVKARVRYALASREVEALVGALILHILTNAVFILDK